MLIDTVERAEVREQLLGALLAHALDAGDVVRRVAHERLEVDESDGVKAVFLAEFLGRVARIRRLAEGALDQAHDRSAADQLKRVTVAGEDDAFVAVFVCAAADRAEQIVRLIARQLAAHDAERVEHLLDDGHLHGKLLVHRLARRLVGIEFQMAEGLFLYVEAYDRAVGPFLVLLLEERREKTVDRVGRRTLMIGERPDAVVGTVDYAVSVYHHDFHAFKSSRFRVHRRRYPLAVVLYLWLLSFIIPHSGEKENPLPSSGKQGENFAFQQNRISPRRRSRGTQPGP